MKITGNEPAVGFEYEEYNSTGLLCKRHFEGLTIMQKFAMEFMVANRITFPNDLPSRTAKKAYDDALCLISKLNGEC